MSEKLSERMRVATAAWYFTDEVAALEQQLAAKDAEIARLRMLTVAQIERIHAIIEANTTDVINYETATDDINAALAETPAAPEVK